MKIEKLEENKLKITLSSTELIEMNINTDEFYPESPQLHSFLFRIMHKVREETGFEITEGPLLTKTTPNPQGLTLLVTRLRPDMLRVKPKKTELPKKHPKVLRTKIRKKEVVYIIYRFMQWNDLSFALNACNADISAEFVYEMNGAYYLLCDTDDPHPLLREFAVSATDDPLLLPMLKEHGKIIAQKEQIPILKNL